MKPKLHMFSAIALVIVFGISNIGLPIVMYLCPMMQDNPSECKTVCENPSQNLALENLNGSCCDSYIVAERITTPFVKIEKNNPGVPVAILALTVATSNDSFSTVRILLSVTSPDDSPPIFLLNSSFLI